MNLIRMISNSNSSCDGQLYSSPFILAVGRDRIPWYCDWWWACCTSPTSQMYEYGALVKWQLIRASKANTYRETCPRPSWWEVGDQLSKLWHGTHNAVFMQLPFYISHSW